MRSADTATTQTGLLREEGGLGSSQERRSHTRKAQRNRKSNRPGESRSRLKRGRVHSEYSGLILSADSAFGFLGVYEPCGTVLRLRIPFLVHKVTLKIQTKQTKV